jgi:hypothetical protein
MARFEQLHSYLWTFCVKCNTKWFVKQHPLTPHQVLDTVPNLVRVSLAQCIKTAYGITDEIAEKFPILNGPLRASALGQLRYALVSHVVEQGVEEGLVPGAVDWYRIANKSGKFLEYSFADVRITFASSSGLFKLPKKSNFRLSRANSNQLTLFEEFDEFEDDRPALLMLHGHKSLKFAQLMVPGEQEGKMIGLAWTENIVRFGGEGEEGMGNFGNGPENPIPAEPLSKIALQIRESHIERLKKAEHDDQ